jgi:hypothetical protein
MILLIQLSLAAAVLLFGAVYVWAWAPIAVLLSAASVACLRQRQGRDRPHQGSALGLDSGQATVAVAAALLCTSVALQLVPLPSWLLTRISPETVAALGRLDVAFAAQTAAGARPWHALSIAPGSTTIALVLLASGVLLAAAVAGLSSSDRRRLVGGLSAVGAAAGIAAIVTLPLGNDRVYGFWAPYQSGAATFGPFVNRNHFAGFALMLIPVMVGHAADLIAGVQVPRAWRERVLWVSSESASRVLLRLAAATVATVALVMSGSRSGFAAFAVTTALLVVLLVRGQRSWSRAAFASGAAVMMFAAATTFAYSGPLAARVASTSTEHWRFRLDSMRDALDLFARFPAVGSGLNTYQHATLVYATRDATAHWSAAHNDYLQLLAEGGGLVMAPVLLLTTLLVLTIRRRMIAERRDGLISWRRSGAIAGLLAIALQSAVDFSLQIPANFWMCCVLIGLAVAPAGWRPRSAVPPRGTSHGEAISRSGTNVSPR